MSLLFYTELIVLYFFLFLSVEISSKETQRCPLYSKSSLEKRECLYKQTALRFLLQNCPKKSKCVIDKVNQTGKCQSTELEHDKPAFPGGKCSKNSECLSERCKEGKCVGGELGEECKSNSDCVFGLSCIGNICSEPKPKNTLCETSLECQMPLRCYKGKCTELFSVDNGEVMYEEDAFLCKSGKVINKKCNEISNENEYCDIEGKMGICSYKDYKGSIIDINENCKCEYNTNAESTGRQRCLKGNKNNDYWNKAIEILKKSTLPEYKNKCNLDENRPGFCREILRNDWSIRKEQMLLDQYLIEAEYSAHFPSDETNKQIIMSTFFGYDNTPPTLKSYKCPKYETTPNSTFLSNKTCAYGINPFTENGDNITVYLNTEPCDWGYFCDFDPKHLLTNWYVNATCKYKEDIFTYDSLSFFYKPNSLQKNVLYPGEECSGEELCMAGSSSDIGKCENGKCTGRGEEQECKRHFDCLVGLFCNETVHKCQAQKQEGDFCNSNNDCMNNLLCMNSTCFALHSLQNGTYLQPKLGKVFKALCAYDFINEETNQCIDELDYFNVSLDRIDEEGFVKCEIGEKCNYTSGDSSYIYQKDCQCSYNSEGFSFCPLSHKYRTKEWKKYFTNKRYSFGNECHTLKRFECVDIKAIDDNDYYKKRTELAHLFHLSSKNIIQIMGKAEHISYTKTLLVLISLIYILI